MSRERHRETETLFKESELSVGGNHTSDESIDQRERSLVAQINDVQRRIQRHREEHFAIVGPEATVGGMNRRQRSLLGQLRALEFTIEHHRSFRSELMGDSLSVELEEARCMKRYAAAKQANELLKQQIHALEADVDRLVSIRNRPYPSISDTRDIQTECAELDGQIHALEMQINLTMQTRDSEKSTAGEAVAVINDLISHLIDVESHYAKLCEFKMESLSSLMELHEKKLKLYQMQREYLDEFGNDEDVIHMDFESGDIEVDKVRLKKLHMEVKFCDDARSTCSNRIDELKRILSTIHV